MPFDPKQFLQSLEPVIHRPHDEVDQLLQHPDGNERRLALKNPNLTEDHLIRALDAFYKDPASPLVVHGDIINHPAAGDRLWAYSALAPRSSRNSSQGFYNFKHIAGGLGRIKDPELLDGLIDHFNAKPSDLAEDLLANPHLTADHERKLLAGRYQDKRDYGEIRHPEVVNELAQKLLEDPEPSVKSLQIFKNPHLDPSFLEKFADKDSFYINKPLWMEAVVKRHPEPHKLLSRTLDRLQDSYTASDLAKVTTSEPKLKNNSEWVNQLLQHPRVGPYALEAELGNKQQIDELARKSNNFDVLRALAEKAHPNADTNTVRTLLERTDLPSPAHPRALAQAALDAHRDHKSLDDSTLLKAFANGRGYIPRDMFDGPDAANIVSEKVINALAEDPNSRFAHPHVAAHPKLSRENQLALAKTNRRSLAMNPNLHPDVISELIKPDPDDMERGLFVPTLMQHPNFNRSHHEQLKSQGDFDKDYRLHQAHLETTDNPQDIRDAFEKIKAMPVGDNEYSSDVSLLRSIFNNHKVELPEDIVMHAVQHPRYEVYNPALEHISQRHFDAIIDRHPEHVARETNDVRHLEKLIGHPDDRVRERVYDNSNTPVELLRAAHENVKAKAEEAKDDSFVHNYRHAALANEADGIKKRIANLDPDSVFEQKVGVRFGTGKLRQVRDLLEERGTPEARLKDLPEKLASVIKTTKAGINPKNGNINLQILQQHIDNLPTASYNVSHSQWDGIQRHNDELSKVFQLNVTTDHVNQMKQAGVYNTFRKLQQQFKRNHPTSDTAFGWVRYTGRPGINPGDGIFVDETQSDHTMPLAEKAYSQNYREKIKSGASAEQAKKEAQQAFDRVDAIYPAEHQKKITEILFGKKHSSEVLMEAFHQHLRDQGHVGTKIAVHSVHSKAPISLQESPGPDGKVDKTKLPGHFVEGYENVPKAMGMQESQYHKDNMETQSSSSLQGVPTHQDDLRKKEEDAIFSQWAEMVKAEYQARHGESIDDDFGPEIEVKLPEHAIWAEYTKRKRD